MTNSTELAVPLTTTQEYDVTTLDKPKTTLVLAFPPDRKTKLTADELAVLDGAYKDWKANNCFCESDGSYRIKGSPRKRAEWNKFVRRLFRNNHDFHLAAQESADTGEVYDPTQTPRFISYGAGNTVHVAVSSRGEITRLAETLGEAPVPLADLIAAALVSYSHTSAGRRAIGEYLSKVGIE